MFGNRVVVRTFRRCYKIPTYEHLQPGNGIPGLLSKDGLKVAWFDRTELYFKMLRSSLRSHEDRPLESLIYEFAEIPSKKKAFSYASLLYNTSFAFSSLRGSSLPLITEKPGFSTLLNPPLLSKTFSTEPLETECGELHQALIESFGSIPEFKTLFLNSNLGINGDGFTWLMARKVPQSTSGKLVSFDKLFIVNTYNSGSPLLVEKNEYYSKLERKLNEDQTNLPTEKEILENAINKAMYKETSAYIPLLAIDASPKVWLHDYGMFGKSQYLDRVWESINWKVVGNKLPEQYKPTEFVF
ncbi:HBR350Wp [Eremothecium sinecaudum]|uniref:HBR350Wp n=1 Tax=Eremothecium sinecaudum TaxID=45286 RepID=A0A125RE29_9SACH|nr:HBR350Wp [Eremothecium sinecaudum]AMD19251.1 HBR350Wp [Eremothecium sinecaudum]